MGPTNPPSSSRLFSALASIEKADGIAAQRRLRSRTVSLQRSKVASTQTEIHDVLLELRILTQRCLTEEECLHDSQNEKEVADNNNAVVMEEVDTLLRNLLASRKELMGNMISGQETTISNNNDTDDDDEVLQNEYYTTLRDNIWKPTLDKLHSNLNSRSGGTSVAASEFKGGIVGSTFWEQVSSTVEHEQSRLPTKRENDNDDGGGKQQQQRPTFDDSKLYQRMLTDFVSTRSSSSSTSSKTGGGVSDPAREAAERLGRALRKRSGADVDISSLWGEDDGTSTTPGGGGSSSKRKKTENMVTAVDRRASKGRKIRYAVHPKLVNFAFPIARPVPTIVENVWFNSLFGGVGKSR